MTSRTIAAVGPSTSTLSWAWAAFSFLGWAGAHVALLFLVSVLAQALALPHATFMGLFAASGVLAGGAVALAGAWLFFPGWRRVPRSALVLLGVGAVVTGGFQLNLAAWAIERFGYFERELIGPTAVLFGVLSGTTVAAFAALVAPVGGRAPAAVATLAGSAVALLVMAGNLGGAADGIPPASWPLAAAMAVSAAFCVAVPALVLRRAMSVGANVKG